jgi:hypothetical protein
MSYPKFNTMDNSKTHGSNLEWETVRRKKVPPAPVAAGGDDGKKYENIELNENYTPRIIREKIFTILESSDNTQSKIYHLNKEVNEFVDYKRKTPQPKQYENIDWRKRLNVLIIHKCCKQNRHEIIASILDNCVDKSIYVDSISSIVTGNTCLLDSAWFGSDQCVNFFINRDANINYVNKKGESVYDMLELGLQDAFKRFPNAKEIVKSRYDDCYRLIKMAEEEKLKPVEEKHVEEKHVEEKPVGKEAFPSEFNNNYTKETLKKDVIKYIETPATFRKLVKFLKENKFSDLLVEVLEDEDMEDLLMDNPYVAQIV